MKIFNILSESDSNWLSCKTISKNLKSAYELLEQNHDISYFTFPAQLSYEKSDKFEKSLRELAEAIKKENPDRLVFLEHFPLPPVFLMQLKVYLKKSEIPQILIHVYGDFTYFSKEWVKFLSSAEDLKIHFVVASDAQKRLLQYFLPANAKIDKCSFPLNDTDYYFDQVAREKCRKRFNIKDDEKIYIYTGRISLQKNVESLLNEFISLCKKHPESKNKLWIVGGFDDSGAEVFGVRTFEGYLFTKFQRTLDRIPEDIRKRITLFGQQAKNEVRELLCGADVFCSLSLFHDDDFGMAPAEALATGLPSFLTAWGGYSSFVSQDNTWDCTLLDVSITHLGHNISLGKFRKSFSEAHSGENRKEKSEAFMKSFGIQNAAITLNRLLTSGGSELGEMSLKLYHYSNLSKLRNQSGMAEYFLPSDDGFYQSIYQNYISENL